MGSAGRQSRSDRQHCQNWNTHQDLRLDLRSPRSICGIHRTRARAAIAAGRGTACDVVRILDAPEIPPRCGGLALLVAVEGAVAEGRIFIALNAKRMAGADGLRRPRPPPPPPPPAPPTH